MGRLLAIMPHTLRTHFPMREIWFLNEFFARCVRYVFFFFEYDRAFLTLCATSAVKEIKEV